MASKRKIMFKCEWDFLNNWADLDQYILSKEPIGFKDGYKKAILDILKEGEEYLSWKRTTYQALKKLRDKIYLRRGNLQFHIDEGCTDNGLEREMDALTWFVDLINKELDD